MAHDEEDEEEDSLSGEAEAGAENGPERRRRNRGCSCCTVADLGGMVVAGDGLDDADDDGNHQDHHRTAADGQPTVVQASRVELVCRR